MSSTKSFAVGVGDLVSVVGYKGDRVVRVLRIESFDAEHVSGLDLLRSSPTSSVYRTYRIDSVDAFHPVIGQDDE